MKTLLLTALALSFTTLPALAAAQHHDCHNEEGYSLNLKPAGLGRKTIEVNAQGTRVQFNNVGSTGPQMDMASYIGSSRDGYLIQVLFNEANSLMGGSDGPSTALAFLVTPAGQTITIQNLNCDN